MQRHEFISGCEYRRQAVHLQALIRRQAELAHRGLALEADAQGIADDTSLACKVIKDKHEGVTEKLAHPIAGEDRQLTKCPTSRPSP